MLSGGGTVLALALAAAQQPSPPPSPAERLARHPYFSKIELESIESHPPYLFLVQKPARADAARAASLAAQLVSILDPLLERFEKEVAVPLGLDQREDTPRLALVVLSSEGDFTNYRTVTGVPWHLCPEALYDQALGAGVLVEDVFQPGRPAARRANAARHALLHVCQQAWYAGGKNAPLESWVLEGMTDAWARREPDAAHAAIEPEWLRWLVQDAGDEARRWTNLRTLDELCVVGEASRLQGFFRTKAPKGTPAPDAWDAYWAFNRQASLLSQFLWESGDESRRSVALALVRQALTAPPGTRLAVESPGVPSDLDREFLAWIAAQHRACFPAENLDAAVLTRALARGPGGTPLTAQSTPGAGPATATSSAPEPRLLLDLADASEEERYAVALHDLALGRTRSAMATFEALATGASEGALRPRCQRELTRAKAWSALAERFLAGLVESQGVIEVTHQGKKLKTKVVGRAEDELLLERGPGRLRVESIPALELAQQMKASSAGEEWVRLYPYVLAGDPRAKKLLREDGGEGSRLLADAPDYVERLRLGRCAAELVALASAALPATPKDVRDAIAALCSWRESARGFALGERRLPALRARVHELLRHEVELLGPHTRLAGKFQVVGQERVRIRYEFDDARELDDFEISRYPVLIRKGLAPTGIETFLPSVRDGRLALQGEGSLRTLFDLAAPLTVRYQLAFSGGSGQGNTFALGVCDDGREGFLWAYEFEHLQVFTKEGMTRASGEPGRYFLETPYALQLEHDGKLATLSVEGLPGPTLDAAARSQGALFLCAQCQSEMHVTSLEIEGQLLPDTFARLVEVRIERELATLVP